MTRTNRTSKLALRRFLHFLWKFLHLSHCSCAIKFVGSIYFWVCFQSVTVLESNVFLVNSTSKKLWGSWETSPESFGGVSQQRLQDLSSQVGMKFTRDWNHHQGKLLFGIQSTQQHELLGNLLRKPDLHSLQDILRIKIPWQLHKKWIIHDGVKGGHHSNMFVPCLPTSTNLFFSIFPSHLVFFPILIDHRWSSHTATTWRIM